MRSSTSASASLIGLLDLVVQQAAEIGGFTMKHTKKLRVPANQKLSGPRSWAADANDCSNDLDSRRNIAAVRRFLNCFRRQLFEPQARLVTKWRAGLQPDDNQNLVRRSCITVR